MINVDNKVRNIYYMLCYSFYGDKLNEKAEATLGIEAFDNIYNLFSLLLCMILKQQIKKGIHKDYNYTLDEVSTIRGRINLNESINHNSLVKKKLYCEYDEYDENCLLNQIIKTTIYYLLKSNKVGNNTKIELKRLNLYFNKVSLIGIRGIKWNQIRFNRNNISYKYVVDLCKLILNGLIVSDKQGKNNFKEFLDDARVSAIYENFVRAYYRKHYPELNATSRKLYLIKKQAFENIPVMKTDITLEYNDKMLIIDTKFYSKILKSNYLDSRCKTISSNHLYQLLAYVDNQDPYKEDKVYGMLLYAQTIDEPSFFNASYLNDHKIIIKTLDMNDEWDNIRDNLNMIAECFKNDSF